MPITLSTSSLSPVAAILATKRLTTAFQPIVELDSGRVVGYEALTRGPRGSALEAPDDLFAAASKEGNLGELDRACRERALASALEAGIDPSLLLFLNVEPAGLDRGGVLDRLGESGLDRASVVVELTERALASRPSEVLAAVGWLRERNCRIALDDVGVDRRSLALMPFLSPDVIKLDMRLAQDSMGSQEAAWILNAVGAESERSGAVILAEGIETERNLLRARAMGATLGQGWLFGKPGRLEIAAPPLDGSTPVPIRRARAAAEQTPFQTVSATRCLRRGDKRLLLAISRQLEREALTLGGEVVVLSTFQESHFFSNRSRCDYERMAAQAALVGALGVGMSARPGGAVRGANLEPDDPLRGEWDVIVVSPHFAAAFVARDLGDSGPDLGRRFDYFLTYDRPLAIGAAQHLLAHIVPTL